MLHLMVKNRLFFLIGCGFHTMKTVDNTYPFKNPQHFCYVKQTSYYSCSIFNYMHV